MVLITEDMSAEARFALRRTRIKRRCVYINVASGLCFLFVPFWAFVRLFFCWSDSCSGIICWFCEIHWLISLLLIVFLVGFVLMSLELHRVPEDRELPEKIADPWIPGVKTVAKTMQTLSDGTRTISSKLSGVRGAEAVSKVARGISVGATSIPGVKTLQKGTIIGAQKASEAVRRMEHGRALLKGDGPEKWTFIFTVVALLAALVLMFEPFKNVFWS